MMKTARILAWTLIALFGMLLLLPWLLPRPGIGGVIPDQPFADSRFISVLGTRLHYRARGSEAASSGPLIILLHGFGGSSFSWSSSLDALEAWQFDVIALDLPPFGYSERIGRGADWPDLVLGVAETLAPQRPLVLIGHSMGAGVAAAAAARSDGRVSQLIFVGGGPSQRRQGQNRWQWLLAIPSVARGLEVVAAHRLLDDQVLGAMLASA